MSFVVIIPTRFAFTRLSERPLQDTNGEPMIVYVLKRACVSGADRIIVATGHPDVVSAAGTAGGEACTTHANRQFDTERLAKVVEKYTFSDDTIIVNIQGDEPVTPLAIVRQVVENLMSGSSGVATLTIPIRDAEEALSPNAVKAAMDAQGYTLYFFRAIILWNRDRFAHSRETIGDSLLRHIGIHGYRAGFTRRYVSWVPSPLEQIGVLKQLRVLWYSEKIHAVVAAEVLDTGVGTPENLGCVCIELR